MLTSSRFTRGLCLRRTCKPAVRRATFASELIQLDTELASRLEIGCCILVESYPGVDREAETKLVREERSRRLGRVPFFPGSLFSPPPPAFFFPPQFPLCPTIRLLVSADVAVVIVVNFSLVCLFDLDQLRGHLGAHLCPDVHLHPVELALLLNQLLLQRLDQLVQLLKHRTGHSWISAASADLRLCVTQQRLKNASAFVFVLEADTSENRLVRVQTSTRSGAGAFRRGRVQTWTRSDVDAFRLVRVQARTRSGADAFGRGRVQTWTRSDVDTFRLGRVQARTLDLDAFRLGQTYPGLSRNFAGVLFLSIGRILLANGHIAVCSEVDKSLWFVSSKLTEFAGKEIAQRFRSAGINVIEILINSPDYRNYTPSRGLQTARILN